MAYHTVAQQEFAWPGAGSQHMWRLEAWLDPAGESARERFELDPAAWLELADDFTVLANGSQIYFRDAASPTVEAVHPDAGVLSPIAGCRGMTSVLFEYLRPFCSEGLDGFTLDVEVIEHEGVPAVVLVYRAPNEGDQPPSDFGYVVGLTNRLVLDAATSLPLALVTESMFADGVPQLVRTATFTNDFVPLDSLAPGFFEPSALGYVEPDPHGTVEAAQSVRPVVWLGQRFESSGGTLPLSGIRLERPGTGPGSRTLIEYEPAVSSQLLGRVSLGVWTVADWTAALGTPGAGSWWDSPRVHRKDVMLDHGRAVLFSGCEVPFDPAPIQRLSVKRAQAPAPPTLTPTEVPDPPSEGEAVCDENVDKRFMAHVYVWDVVVTINASDCSSCSPAPLPPEYDSLPGLELLARQLVRAE